MQRLLAALIAPLLFATLLPAIGCGGGDDAPPGDDGGDGPTPTGITLIDFQAASVVCGQTSFVDQSANQGGAAGASTLAFPAGRTVDGSWFVCDTANNRVLGFPAPPTTHGESAAFALGQPSLVATAPGNGAGQLNRPNDACTAAGRLFVADRDNHRVLIWNTLPAANGAAADVVVGQAGFGVSVPAATQNGMNTPRGVFVAGGKLLVADAANNRVLIYNSVPAANGALADVVVGQTLFTNSANGLGQAQLDGPQSVWSDGVRLIVADTLNNRVLIWNSIPTTNGAPADIVVGQPDFTTNAGGTTSQSLNWPNCVFSNGVQLFVVDSSNSRVLIYPFPTASHPAATGVIGQSDFVHGSINDDNQDGIPDAASARTLFAPAGVTLLGNRMYVTDLGNHRVLVFQGL